MAAVSLSLLWGLPLGVLASSAWWQTGSRSRLRRGLSTAALVASRTLIATMRSTHELLWAVLFLCAMGLTDLTAIAAIAIPYGGTLAKVFSELLDEAPTDAADTLEAAGAGPGLVFAVGLIPRALPDMIAYAMYRFECALRASAVLGFFGIPTFGYFIALSFENLQYREVWSYLYALLALVLVVDWWSGVVRHRLLGGQA